MPGKGFGGGLGTSALPFHQPQFDRTAGGGRQGMPPAQGLTPSVLPPCPACRQSDACCTRRRPNPTPSSPGCRRQGVVAHPPRGPVLCGPGCGAGGADHRHQGEGTPSGGGGRRAQGCSRADTGSSRADAGRAGAGTACPLAGQPLPLLAASLSWWLCLEVAMPVYMVLAHKCSSGSFGYPPSLAASASLSRRSWTCWPPTRRVGRLACSAAPVSARPC